MAYYSDEMYLADLEELRKNSAAPQQAIPTGSDSYLKETAANVGNAAIGLGEAAVGAGNILTGGALQRAIGDYYRPQEARQIISDWGYTDERKQQEQRIQDAEGFWDTAGEIATSPRAAVGRLTEMAPTMMGAGLLGKGAKALGLSEATGAAVGEGAITAAQQGQQVIGEDPNNVSGMYMQLPAGAITGAISRVAGNYGGNVESMLVGGGQRAIGNVAQRAAKGFIGEGVLEELPQSMQEQVWQNLGTGEDWDKNVLKAGAEGMVLGGMSGAGISALTGRTQAQQNRYDLLAGEAANPDEINARLERFTERAWKNIEANAPGAEAANLRTAQPGEQLEMPLDGGGNNPPVPGAPATVDLTAEPSRGQGELDLSTGMTGDQVREQEQADIERSWQESYGRYQEATSENALTTLLTSVLENAEAVASTFTPERMAAMIDMHLRRNGVTEPTLEDRVAARRLFMKRGAEAEALQRTFQSSPDEVGSLIVEALRRRGLPQEEIDSVDQFMDQFDTPLWTTLLEDLNRPLVQLSQQPAPASPSIEGADPQLDMITPETPTVEAVEEDAGLDEATLAELQDQAAAPAKPMTMAEGIEQGMGEIASAMEQGARDDTAQALRTGKTDRLTLRRPESIQTAMDNPNYNVVVNEDGTATIIGVLDSTGVWEGTPTAEAQAAMQSKDYTFVAKDGRTYTIKLSGIGTTYEIRAYNDEGVVVGSLFPAAETDFGASRSQATWMSVDAKYRRLGINSAMNEVAAQNVPGYDKQSNALTPDGYAWYQGTKNAPAPTVTPVSNAAQVAATPKQVRGALGDATKAATTTSPRNITSDVADLVVNSWLDDAASGEINRDSPMVYSIRNANGKELHRLSQKVGHFATAVARFYRALARLDNNSRRTPYIKGEDSGQKVVQSASNAIASIDSKYKGGATYLQLTERTKGVQNPGAGTVLATLKQLYPQEKFERGARYSAEQLAAVRAELMNNVVIQDGKMSDINERDTAGMSAALEEANTAYEELKAMFGTDQEGFTSFMAEMMRRMKESKYKQNSADRAAADAAMQEEGTSPTATARDRFDVLVSKAFAAARSGRSFLDVTGGEIRESFEAGKAPKKFGSATEFVNHLRNSGTAYERSLASILKRFQSVMNANLVYELGVVQPGQAYGEAIANPDGTYTIILRRNSPDIFLHEAVHVATMQWLNTHRTHGSVRRLVNAYNQASKSLGKLGELGMTPEQETAVKAIFAEINKVATDNPQDADYYVASEFMAYSMSNPDMAAFLRTLAEWNLTNNNNDLNAEIAGIRAEGAKRGNVFTALYEALRNFFRNVFGTKEGNTILDRVVNETLFIMEAQQIEPEQNAASTVPPSLKAAVAGILYPGNVPPSQNRTTQELRAALDELPPERMTMLDRAVKALFSPFMPMLTGISQFLDKGFTNLLVANPGLASFLNNFIDNLAVDRIWPQAADALRSYSNTRNGAAAIGNMVEEVLRAAPPEMIAPIIDALDDPAKVSALPAELVSPATVLREKIMELRDAAAATGALDPSLKDALPSELIQYAIERSDLATQGFSLGIIKRSYPEKIPMDLRKDTIVGASQEQVKAMVGAKFYALHTPDGDFDTMSAVPPPAGVPEIAYTLARVEGDKLVFERPSKDPRNMKGAEAAIHLANTVAMMSKVVAAHQFVDEIISYNDAPGTVTENKFVRTEEEAKLTGVKPTFTWEGFAGTNLHGTQRETARRPDVWVKLAGPSWGKLEGRIVNGAVLASLSDMHSQGKFISSPTYNRAMVLWKQGKTGISPATHVTNVMSSFLMAYMHDIPLSSINTAFRIVYAAQYPNGIKGKFKPAPLTAEERAMYNAFIGSGALMGNFSTNELHGKMLSDIVKNESPDDGSGYTLAAKLGEIEGLKMAYNWAEQGWDTMTKLYENEDNVFRLAAFMTKMSDLDRTNPDWTVEQKHQAAGKFAKYSMIDYSINARGVNAMRQTFWPFLAWPYRALPMLAKVAIQKPWKMAVITGAVYGINALAYAASGDDEEEERANTPEWARNKLFGLPFGPNSMVRVPMVGDHGHPVFFNVAKWVPGGDIFTASGEPVAGLPFVPSFMTPGGPVAAGLFAAFGYDTFRGDSVYNDANSVSENVGASLGLLSRQLMPGLSVQAYDLAAKWGKDDVLGNPVDMTFNVLRTIGLKTYEFNAETEQYKQNAEIQALQREYKAYVKSKAKDMWRTGEIDYEELDRVNTDAMERLNQRANEIKGIEE